MTTTSPNRPAAPLRGRSTSRPDELEARRRAPAVLVLAALVAAVTVSAVVACGVGAYPATPGEVFGVLAERAGVAGADVDAVTSSLLWEIRFPRVALAVVVGGCLGCAGAAMQGTFANPLAEPGIVGVSAGAVLGAVLQIVVLGPTLLGPMTLPAAAFVGGLGAMVVVYWSARADGRTEVVTLVLTGIAVNAFAGALIGLAMFLSTDDQLRAITFWTLGSLAQATWAKVAIVAPFAVVGLAAACMQARRLDLLALGERPARHLGVDVEQLRLRMLVTVAVLTAAAVAVSGEILFVGLVVPHLVRMVGGPGHRLLLPASALGGALVLVWADLAARTLAAPAELPLGVLTALVGGPFFFWQLRRTRATQGGWA